MLPFLKQNKEGSASGPVESEKRSPDEDKEESFDGLESSMDELHQALMSKNYKDAAQIFRSCLELAKDNNE